MKRWIIAIAVVGLSLTAGRAVYADPQECENAAHEYNSVVSGVSDALREYASCVDGSEGKDDCGSEFDRLRDAHSEFEDAVSHYQSECE
jgi:hypothetical protein